MLYDSERKLGDVFDPQKRIQEVFYWLERYGTEQDLLGDEGKAGVCELSSYEGRTVYLLLYSVTEAIKEEQAHIWKLQYVEGDQQCVFLMSSYTNGKGESPYVGFFLDKDTLWGDSEGRVQRVAYGWSRPFESEVTQAVYEPESIRYAIFGKEG